MITELKPYPAMKDSGVEWLGEVPEYWDVWRARYLFTEIDHRSKTGEETHLSMSQRLGLVPSDQVQSSLTSESYAGGKLCEPEDLVLNRLKAHLGVFALAKQAGVISPDYSVFRRRCASNMTYFEQTLRSPACRGELRVRAKGIVEGFWRLYTDDFYDIRLPVPPPPEQTAIVRYLDHVDLRVKRLVRAKRKLVALLTEQKQAIIHRAVTRGLDPDVRLKDSDVEWLGKVPEHWEVRKIKHCLSAPLAYGVLKPDKFDGPGAVPIIRILDIAAGVIREDRLERISPAQHQEFRRTQVVPGDVLISVVGTIGRSVIVPATLGRANLSRALCRVQVNEQITPEFLDRFCWSHSFLQQADSIPAGAAQRVLNLGDLRQFDIGVPPLPEQVAIVEYLEQATTDLDSAIDRASREIGLLEEYRTCLIAGVVTGKLDVREAVAVLPEVDPLDVEDHLDDGTDAAAEADLADLNAIPEEAEA